MNIALATVRANSRSQSGPFLISTFISYPIIFQQFRISGCVAGVRQYFITRISFRTIFHFAFPLCFAFVRCAFIIVQNTHTWCLCYSEIQIFSKSRRQYWKHETYCYCGRLHRRRHCCRCHLCRNRLARIKSILIKRINDICFCESAGGICALHTPVLHPTSERGHKSNWQRLWWDERNCVHFFFLFFLLHFLWKKRIIHSCKRLAHSYTEWTLFYYEREHQPIDHMCTLSCAIFTFADANTPQNNLIEHICTRCLSISAESSALTKPIHNRTDLLRFCVNGERSEFVIDSN